LSLNIIWSHEIAHNEHHIPRVAVRCFSITSLITKRIFHLFFAAKIKMENLFKIWYRTINGRTWRSIYVFNRYTIM